MTKILTSLRTTRPHSSNSFRDTSLYSRPNFSDVHKPGLRFDTTQHKPAFYDVKRRDAKRNLKPSNSMPSYKKEICHYTKT